MHLCLDLRNRTISGRLILSVWIDKLVEVDFLSLLVDDFNPAEIIDGIRQLYKIREGWFAPFPWCEEFHFRLESIFIRLKVISRKKTRGTVTDNIVNMSGIFKPHEECQQPRTVLIEGKPGMGKTTYCKKIVYDWATGKQDAEDCFPRFETVLLIKCRDMKSDIWEAIDDQVLPRKVGEDVRERFFNFICQNQSDVLLVLDGLDEVPTSELPVFTEIIQGRRELPNCRMVATTRHEAGIKLRIHCDTLLQIEGFTEKDAREFFFKYFGDKENLAKELLSKLESDTNLKEMAANPLNTALLCLICEEFQGIFPESRTQLYVEIIQCILRRYRKKKGLPETNENLIQVYEAQLKHLGRIALNGLLEDKLDFEESELKGHTDELPVFGFLSVQTGGSKLRPCRHFSFLHKSFQEHFAALYLCCQLLNKEISIDMLTANRRYLKELKELLSFTCGMVAARCKETAEALIKSITVQVNDDESFLSLLGCISECRRDDSSFHLKMARISGSFLKLQSLDLDSRLTSGAGVVLLAEAVKMNPTLTGLHLDHSGIGDQGITGLAEALKVNFTLTVLHLDDNDIGDRGAIALAEALKVNSTLTELHLYDNGIGDQGATALAEALKVNSTLTELQLHHNNIGDQGATGFAEALKVNSILAVLYLSGNGIADQGATGLAEALKVNSRLTKLYLQGNGIGYQGAIGLAEALQVNSTLTELYLHYCGIGDQGATGLAEALQVNSTLTVLNLNGNGIGDQGATGLAEALKLNSTLTRLHLYQNSIGAEGATGLAEALRVNSTLTVLKLTENDIGDQGTTGLAEALKLNSALTELDLSNAAIGDQGATGLAEALEGNLTLSVLDLSNNNVGDQGTNGLAEALKENLTLTELDLSNTAIGDQGATGLAEALKVNSALTVLYLRNNAIGDQGAIRLAEALKMNSSMRLLDLSSNNIGQTVLSELPRLGHNNRIIL